MVLCNLVLAGYAVVRAIASNAWGGLVICWCCCVFIVVAFGGWMLGCCVGGLRVVLNFDVCLVCFSGWLGCLLC